MQYTSTSRAELIAMLEAERARANRVEIAAAERASALVRNNPIANAPEEDVPFMNTAQLAVYAKAQRNRADLAEARAAAAAEQLRKQANATAGKLYTAHCDIKNAKSEAQGANNRERKVRQDLAECRAQLEEVRSQHRISAAAAQQLSTDCGAGEHKIAELQAKISRLLLEIDGHKQQVAVARADAAALRHSVAATNEVLRTVEANLGTALAHIPVPK